MKRYFLGIDIGTFESRGILIDESFRVAADASVPHGMDNPQPGWFEQEAEGLPARAICHEYDHLDGHIFKDITHHMLTEEELQKLDEE